jgi:ribonuclease-3
VAKQFVHSHWHDLAKELNEPPKDPKTALQEWAQGQGLPLPDYQVADMRGPSHAPQFTVVVRVEGRGEGQAVAASKKAAERAAAADLLEKLR